MGKRGKRVGTFVVGIPTIDSIERVQECLNCSKPECTNCWEYK